jgi:nucleotidyltransferase AbiEii toxin of type IV toxin-antitoxin system
VLKYRDVWDVWYLVNRLDAHVDRNLVQHKFADYGTIDIETRARRRREELMKESTAKAFLGEMKRFLPSKRVAELTEMGVHRAVLGDSGELIKRAVLMV